MKLENTLKQELVFITDGVEGTRGLYGQVAHFLKGKGVIGDEKLVKRLLIKRESLHSTAIGRGAATPHIYSPEFASFTVAVVLIRQGLDYLAPDGQPVYLSFLIMSDDRDVGCHLKTLAHLARLVSQTDVVEAARGAADPAALMQILLEKERALS